MSQYQLTRMDICGFRGFNGVQQVVFGKPLTLLSGANRQGKSSIVNALEWALFGPEVAAIKYGIRERDGWKVKNQDATDCYVECTLDSLDSEPTIVFRRTYRTERTCEFWYKVGTNPAQKDEKDLRHLLRITSADYLASVHLHPEILRNIVVDTPRGRKEAIDRLLGLSELRDQEGVLAATKPNRWTDDIDQKMRNLSEQLVTALNEKKRSVEEDRTALSAQFAASELNLQGGLRYAEKLTTDLAAYCGQYGLQTPPLAAPKKLEELITLQNELPKILLDLRNQNPILQDQSSELTTKNDLEGLKGSWVSQRNSATDAEQQLQEHHEKRTPAEILAEVEVLKAQRQSLETRALANSLLKMGCFMHGKSLSLLDPNQKAP